MTSIKLDEKYIFEPEYPDEFENLDFAIPGKEVKVLTSYGKSGADEIFCVMFDGDIEKFCFVGEFDLVAQ